MKAPKADRCSLCVLMKYSVFWQCGGLKCSVVIAGRECEMWRHQQGSRDPTTGGNVIRHRQNQ